MNHTLPNQSNVTEPRVNVTAYEEIYGQSELSLDDWIVLFYGLIALIPNSILLYVLLKNKLHKRISFLYVAAYSMNNMLTGFAFVWSAIRRVILFTMEPFRLTPFQCLIWAFYLNFYAICDILGLAIPLLISFDRFVAVMSHRLYSLMTHKVAYWLLGLVWLSIAADLTYCWISVYQLPDDVLVSALCTGALYSSYEYDFSHRVFLTVLSYIGLAFYGGALLVIVCRRDKSNSVRAAAMKREAVITRRLSYLILLTVFLQTMPLTLSFIEIDDDTMSTIYIVVYIMDILNMATFVLIFTAIYPELRKGFLLLCCPKRSAVVSNGNQKKV